MPSRASMVTVNAVWKGDSFFAAIRSRPSSSQRSAVSARQISPRPCVAMKLIASGVANWAASVRSPSFSRSSASQTTTIRPARTSSSASSIGLKGGFVMRRSASRRTWPTGRPPGSRPARRRRAQRRALERLRDQRHLEAPASSTALTVSETPSTAIDPSRRRSAAARRARRSAPRARTPPRVPPRPSPVPSTWPCTTWPPRRSPARSGSSRLTSSPAPSGPSEVRRSVSGITSAAEAVRRRLEGGEADAVDGDRVARRQLGGERRLHLQPAVRERANRLPCLRRAP